MNETVETKVCPYCAETIKAAAKVCPSCRSTLRITAKLLLPRATTTLALVIFFYGPLLLGSWWVRDLSQPGRDFGPYRDKIIISDTAIYHGHLGDTNTVSTVGYLRNESLYPWKALQLEVQYFDSSGKLIDTTTETLSYQELPPGITEAFRIRSAAAFDAVSYASNKVFVRTAKDARKLVVLEN